LNKNKSEIKCGNKRELMDELNKKLWQRLEDFIVCRILKLFQLEKQKTFGKVLNFYNKRLQVT
jgi:hypothetical protein